MCAGLLVLVQRVVGMGEPVLGPGLIDGLAQFGGEREGPTVVVECCIGVTGGVLNSAEALMCFELIVEVAAFLGEVEQPSVVVGGRFVPVLPSMYNAEAD